MTTPDPARVLPDKVRRLEARVAVLEDALDIANRYRGPRWGSVVPELTRAQRQTVVTLAVASLLWGTAAMLYHVGTRHA